MSPSFTATTKQITGSFWVYVKNATQDILSGRGSNDLYIRRGGTQALSIRADDGASIILQVNTLDNTLLPDQWYHVLFSFDLSDTNRRHLYINDVPSLDNITTYTDANMVFDAANFAFCSRGTTGTQSEMGAADFWLQPGLYIDFSIEENRRAFIDAAGNPVDLGTDGSGPTGTAPDIFLSGDTDDWHTNKGTGGGFTENGTLTTAPSPREGNYTWQQIGNDSGNIGGSEGSVAALSQSRIAFISDLDGILQTYDFDGTNWTKISTDNGDIGGVNNGTMDTLDNNTIVYGTGSAGGSVRTFQFDGATWNQIGNTHTISGDRELVAALTPTLIAATNIGTSLRALSWDGTDWTQVGSAFTVPFTIGRGDVEALDEDTVVICSDTGGLQAFDFNGSTRSASGNLYTSTWGRCAAVALSENRIAVGGANIEVLEFNGTDWHQIGSSFSMGAQQPFLTLLKPNTVVHYSGGNDDVRAFGFAYCTSPQRPQGSIIYESTNDQMQYCDGENWIPMGPPGDGGAGCADPVGAAGDLTYNTTYNIMQYCEGDTWIPIGRSADPCDNPSVTVGTQCIDGSYYAGLSPDGNVPMYVASSKSQTTTTWNNGTTGFVTTNIQDRDTGEANTAALIALSNVDSPYAAATYCDTLSTHGKTDWYLPALDELSLLYNSGSPIAGVTVGGSNYYWSSTENVAAPTSQSLTRRFTDGSSNDANKNGGRRVRCVRK